jgi:hypothetical protein
MGACSTTTCRMGFKRCGNACVEMNACCPVAESCFNGMDDDCDGNADCADSDCTPTTQCVPDPGDTFRVGVQLASAAATCPTSFNTGRTVIRKDPRSASPSCDGCSCGGPQIDCTVHSVCGYQMANACPLPGCTYLTVSPPSPDGCYVFEDSASLYFGFQISRSNGPEIRRCSIVTGLPKVPAIVWGREATFCQAERSSRAGCPGGNICVPRQTATVCAVTAGAKSCPTGFRTREVDWFLDADDRRTCDPATCSCEATGGTCPTTVSFGPDQECGGTVQMEIGTTQCLDLIYNPGFRLIGTQTPPSCAQSNRVTGTLAGKNQQTLCCL